ncbi:MAG: hypothetical protein AABY03_02250 [Nanoarchaeota archaeon]
MRTQNIIYPLIFASVIFYSGCAQTEAERIESCAEVSRRIDRELGEQNIDKKSAFPDMNFACDRDIGNYNNKKQ